MVVIYNYTNDVRTYERQVYIGCVVLEMVLTAGSVDGADCYFSSL